MLRLFITSAEPDLWREVALRLRGATLEAGSDALRADRPDALAFERPAHVAPHVVERLLSDGKHILMAGHPGWSVEIMDSMVRVAQQAGAQLSVVNLDRYLPSRRLIQQQVADRLAPIGLVRSHRWESAAQQPGMIVAGLPARLVDDLDLAMWLCGQPVERAYGVEHVPGDRRATAGRSLQVHLAFARGMALVDYTDRLPAGDGYRALSVIGFAGAAYADDHQNVQLLYAGGRPQAVCTGEGLTARAGAVQDFVAGLAAGRDLSETVRAWRPVFEVAMAVNRSLASACAVALEGR